MNVNRLFAVKTDVTIAKVLVLIPNLLWCRRGIRMRGVQPGLVNLVALAEKKA